MFWFPFDSIMRNFGEARMLFGPLAYFTNAFLIGALIGFLWNLSRRRFSRVVVDDAAMNEATRLQSSRKTIGQEL